MTSSATVTELSESDLKGKGNKEVLIIQDEGLFTHTTGDTYEGTFEIKKKDRTVKMQGYGVYKTDEGDLYIGIWENDKLGVTEDVHVIYTDGSRYEGPYNDWCYNKHGKYFCPDETLLECEFQDNFPVGKMQLTDPNGHIWLGKASQGYAWFSPINHYLGVLEKTKMAKPVSKRGTEAGKKTK